MSVSIQDRHLIERHLRGELSGIELENFNKRLGGDVEFKRDVELQQLLYGGIRLAEHRELQATILSSLRYSRSRIPAALKMIILFLIVTGAGISFWLYIGTEPAQREQEKSWLAFLKNKLPELNEQLVPQKEEKQLQREPVDLHDQERELVPKEGNGELTDTVVPASVPELSDTVGKIPSEEIVVKQDQLLISTKIQVLDRTQDTTARMHSNLADETAEKLNPAADLPIEERPVYDCQVEFWVSPINYRGYKLSKNKLVLFGIDVPDAVRLYRVNETLYMSYLDEYYRLSNSLDFISYHKLKEAEIPLALK